MVVPRPHRDLGRDDVARVGDHVLERDRAHRPVVGVGDLRRAAVEPQRPGVVDRRVVRDVALLERGDGGHHLEHRSRLVDAGYDGVDEARPGPWRRSSIVVRVVRGIARLGVDLARVRVHDDRRHALARLSAIHAASSSCSSSSCRPASIVSRMSTPGAPGVLDDRGLGHRPAVASRWDTSTLGWPASASGITARRRIGPAVACSRSPGAARRASYSGRRPPADTRAAARARARCRQAAVGHRGPDPVRDVGVDVAGEDHVRLARVELVAQGGGAGGVEAEQAHERVARPRRSSGDLRAGRRRRRAGRARRWSRGGPCRSGRRCRPAGSGPRRGPSSGGAPRPSAGRARGPASTRSGRPARRPDQEGDQEDEQARSGIGATQHRSSGSIDQRAGTTTGRRAGPARRRGRACGRRARGRAG